MWTMLKGHAERHFTTARLSLAEYLIASQREEFQTEVQGGNEDSETDYQSDSEPNANAMGNGGGNDEGTDISDSGSDVGSIIRDVITSMDPVQ